MKKTAKKKKLNKGQKQKKTEKEKGNVEAQGVEQLVKLEKESATRTKPRVIAKEAFKLWLTIPNTLRGKSNEVLEAMGIVDRDVLFLASITTQRAFAEFCGVDEITVSRWYGDVMGEDGSFKQTKKFFRKISGNMLAALYRKGLIEGDAPRVALFMKIIEDWHETFGLEHSGEVEYHLDDEEKAALDKLLSTVRE